jgi:MFS transporter, DHA1 family, staphyloferrin B biosynthesis exporter
VIRSSLPGSSTPSRVGRNLAFDFLAAVGVGVTAALITTLLPTVARRIGVEPLGLAALAAAPFVANLLGVFAGRLGPRSSLQLAIVRGLGAASLLALFVVPSAPVMILASVAFWLSLSFGGPFHLRLWGSMYPARMRGRVVGFLGMGRAAAGALAAFGGGVVADRIGGPSAVALAGVVGVACAIGYVGLRADSAQRPRPFSARDSLRALRERPVLGRVALAQGFYGGGLIAAAPLYALVNVDRLNLSLGDVGIIGILTALATTIAFLGWGALADRRGGLVAMRLGSAVGLVSLVAYALAPHVTVLWVAAVASGIGSASIELGIASMVSDQTPLASRAAAMAGWNAITGARGIVAAFLMSALLQVGLVDVTTGLLLCAAVSAIGVVLFARITADLPADVRETVPEGAARSRRRTLAPTG